MMVTTACGLIKYGYYLYVYMYIYIYIPRAHYLQQLRSRYRVHTKFKLLDETVRKNSIGRTMIVTAICGLIKYG